MVKIVQVLCPQRHCLLASCYEEERSNFQEACDALKVMMQPVGPYNNWCGLCGSREIFFEEGTTKYKTLQDAAPWMVQTQTANIKARKELDDAGLSYGKLPKN